ncbi:unnamed protein product [Caenorhabditis auriculariae]|uniref:Uncharacterized protein n=1 Tax=Caenorhabditis auriculariae TaxID=2777116 RepID=A0A8S1HV15_9PELO|nr:unnamed protein product [Caenorhabditis auriculariae]
MRRRRDADKRPSDVPLSTAEAWKEEKTAVERQEPASVAAYQQLLRRTNSSGVLERNRWRIQEGCRRSQECIRRRRLLMPTPTYRILARESDTHSINRATPTLATTKASINSAWPMSWAGPSKVCQLRRSPESHNCDEVLTTVDGPFWNLM